jgi:deoxyribose-phosphate aldolase
LTRELLASTPVRVASTADAAARGAEEIDIVLNRSAFLSGHREVAGRELARARTAAGGAQLKVTIEVGELITLDSIRAASRLAIDAGANFVKTSTRRTPAGASPETVLAILDVIAEHASMTGRRVGIEIVGGVRTADDALGYVGIVRSILGDEWLCPELMRFEASSLLDDVLADLATTESVRARRLSSGRPDLRASAHRTREAEALPTKRAPDRR